MEVVEESAKLASVVEDVGNPAAKIGPCLSTSGSRSAGSSSFVSELEPGQPGHSRYSVDYAHAADAV